jgi:hypothetical protein
VQFQPRCVRGCRGEQHEAISYFMIWPILALLFVSYMIQGVNIPREWLLAMYAMVLPKPIIVPWRELVKKRAR